MHTRFILIQTSHAGNVGAVARAMKVMGFEDLVLVAPRWPNVLRRQETIQRASGALDVLAHARIVATLDEALEGVQHLCATAMTPRDFGPPNAMPRAHFDALLKQEQETQQCSGVNTDSAEKIGVSSVAFLFGSERFGMANEDVYRCHVALTIPTNPAFGSLNLAAAVQVIAYEWRLALGGFAAIDGTRAGPSCRGRCGRGRGVAWALAAGAGRDRFSRSRSAQEAAAAPAADLQSRAADVTGDSHPARHREDGAAGGGKARRMISRNGRLRAACDATF